MINNVKGWIELLSLLVGLSGALFGVIIWYRSSIEKSYAAQRDFQYLMKNQEQMLSSVKLNAQELDRRFDHLDRELIEIRNWVQNLAMLVRTDVCSSGIARQDKPPT